jgi:hypothetical protein
MPSRCRRNRSTTVSNRKWRACWAAPAAKD